MLTLMSTIGLEGGSGWLWIAQIAGAVSTWAAAHAPKPERELGTEARIADLTLKVRHPWRYRLQRVFRGR